MEEKFQNKYRISSFRKPNWDYGAHGLYFITVCTRNMGHYFGELVETQNNVFQKIDDMAETKSIVSLQKSEIGSVAFDNWMQIPKYHPFIELDAFVIMPNHVHGILFINKPVKENWEPNKFGSQSRNLASVIRGYKSSVKTYATKNNIDFEWQPKYHDRVIRDKKEHSNVVDYINRNPEMWIADKNNIFMP